MLGLDDPDVCGARLREIQKEWVKHYNERWLHRSLGPWVPHPPQDLGLVLWYESRHRLAAGARVRAKSVPGGLHHEYSIAMAPSARIGQSRTVRKRVGRDMFCGA
jgi:hypothetical protein